MSFDPNTGQPVAKFDPQTGQPLAAAAPMPMPVAVAQPVAQQPVAVAQPVMHSQVAADSEDCSCCATTLNTYGAIILILSIVNIFSVWTSIPGIFCGASLIKCCGCTKDAKCITTATMILNFIFAPLYVLYAIMCWAFFSDQLCAWIYEISVDDYKDYEDLIEFGCAFAEGDDKQRCDTCDFYQGSYPVMVIIGALLLCLPSAILAMLARNKLHSIQVMA